MFRINRKTVCQVFLVLLIAATLCFIWSNSLNNAAESTVKSDRMIEKVKPIIDPNDKINPDIFEILIRKTAHFTEFAVLGVEIFLLMSTLEKWNKAALSSMLVSVGVCFAVGCTDEIIQLTSAGRACRFTDVLIDTLGAAAGIGFLLLFNLVRKKSLNRKRISKL